MILERLSLTNFKNIAGASLEFSAKINCFIGNNGMGKSNLLDAVHYLSFARSFSRLPDSMLIRRGETYGILAGEYERHGAPETINVGFRAGARKSFRRGGKEYRRLSQHIGLLPVVLISPADQSLVAEGAEERRRFLDMLISQADAPYLEALVRYNATIEQRNRLLRDEVEDPLLYESLEMLLDADAALITRRRGENTERLAELFDRYYTAIAPEGEAVTLSYHSSLEDYGSMARALEATRRRDSVLHYTSKGPHRDDLLLTVNGMPARQTASQGQTKSLTIALRLAQYDLLRQATGQAPLLLLDDIFDKLDAARVERIMALVARDDFGQIFITDTNRKHIDEILSRTGPDFRLWRVTDGEFTPLLHDETH